MTMYKPFIASCLLSAACGVLVGCNGNGGGGGSGIALDSDHSGWRYANCFESGCHTAGHNGAGAPYECTECHGTNGAPDGHGQGCGTDLTCHGGKDHGGEAAGFPPPESCEACHGT